jgi:hypothetical protein
MKLSAMLNDSIVSPWMLPICLCFLCLFALGADSNTEEAKNLWQIATAAEKDTSSHSAKDSLPDFDSLYVIHFHPIVQCSCCINVGNFSRKGLEKYYAEAFKDGRVIFKECNIDEDTLTAKQYSIFGSALGFSKFPKGKEEFKEIESVWEFCEDEKKFLPCLRKELDRFLLGAKADTAEATTPEKADKPEAGP